MTPEFRKAVGIVFIVLGAILYAANFWFTRQYSKRITEKYPDLKKRAGKLTTKELPPDDEQLRQYHQWARRTRWVSEITFIGGLLLAGWDDWIF